MAARHSNADDHVTLTSNTSTGRAGRRTTAEDGTGGCPVSLRVPENSTVVFNGPVNNAYIISTTGKRVKLESVARNDRRKRKAEKKESGAGRPPTEEEKQQWEDAFNMTGFGKKTPRA
jgi:hypothetical protein